MQLKRTFDSCVHRTRARTNDRKSFAAKSSSELNRISEIYDFAASAKLQFHLRTKFIVATRRDATGSHPDALPPESNDNEDGDGNRVQGGGGASHDAQARTLATVHTRTYVRVVRAGK